MQPLFQPLEDVAPADATNARPRFTFVEFFAGVGGFRVALEAGGGKCLLACEYCRFASSTYCLNWPGSQGDLVGDIHKIAAAQVPPHDVFAAGFPCQSFSNAGRLGRFLDERGKLFYEMVRIIRGCQPRALLLENVRGLLTDDETLVEVLAALADAGYPDVQVRLLDAASLVPQRRQRTFLVGFRDVEARVAFEWPSLPSLGRVVDDILEHPLGQQAPPDAHLALPAEKWRRVATSSYFAEWPGARLLPGGAIAQTLQATYKSGCLLYSQFVPQAPMEQYPRVARAAAVAAVAAEAAQQNALHRVEDKQQHGGAPAAAPAAAKASSVATDAGVNGRPTPPEEEIGPSPRFFSPRECARLMGFPESFRLPKVPEGVAYKQMGNAVCPPLVAALGVSVARALEAEGRSGRTRPALAAANSHADTAEALGRLERWRSVGARSEAHCEAVATALELVAKAAPAGRAPRLCWLPAAAHAALGGASFEDIAKARPEADEAEMICLPPDLETEAEAAWRVRRVRGASYHDLGAPSGCKDHQSNGWYGPYPIHLVLDAARERRRECGGGDPPGLIACKSVGTASRSVRIPTESQPTRPQPQQTLPSPTNALKAEIAARCMRPFLMASGIREAAGKAATMSKGA